MIIPKFSEQPILVIDSGVGGISVLRELVRQMPGESFIYFGDSANAPYGDHSEGKIRGFVEHIVSRFLKQGIKCVVIACNTATAAAATYLREKYPQLPVVGMEPALKLAAEKVSIPHPKILVLATDFTIHSEKLHILMNRLEEKADFTLLPAPGIVPFVEKGDRDGRIGIGLKNYLEVLLQPYLCEEKHPDAIVLGCTHYPFLRNTIGRFFDNEIPVFDGGPGTARHTKEILAQKELLRPVTDGYGTVELLNSDPEALQLEKNLFMDFYSSSASIPGMVTPEDL